MGGTAVAMMLRHRHSVLQDRLAARNRDLPPGTFRITAAEMEEFASFFERPTPEELALGTED